MRIRLALLALLPLALLLLAACAPYGRWEWRRPDGSVDRPQLDRTIDLCEDYAARVSDEGPFRAIPNARPYGGWGDFDFKFCMNQHDWFLRYELIPPAHQASTRQ
jgi:hypothetical protein